MSPDLRRVCQIQKILLFPVREKAQSLRFDANCAVRMTGASRGLKMKLALTFSFTAFIAIGAAMASVSEANAVVCARGVYRAGCAGPRGAVVGHRHVYRHPYHRGVVVRRRVY
jgi:hypothetical protein